MIPYVPGAPTAETPIYKYLCNEFDITLDARIAALGHRIAEAKHNET